MAKSTGGVQRRVLADGTLRVYRPKRARYYGCYACGYRVNADALERTYFNELGTLSADDSLLASWILAARPPARDVEGMKREVLALEREVSDVAEQARRDRLFDLALSARVELSGTATPFTRSSS